MSCWISLTVGSVPGGEGRWYCVLPRVGGGWNYIECHPNINGRHTYIQKVFECNAIQTISKRAVYICNNKMAFVLLQLHCYSITL